MTSQDKASTASGATDHDIVSSLRATILLYITTLTGGTLAVARRSGVVIL